MHDDNNDDVSVVMSVAGPVQEIMVQMGGSHRGEGGIQTPQSQKMISLGKGGRVDCQNISMLVDFFYPS